MTKKRFVFLENGAAGIRDPQQTPIENAHFAKKAPNAEKQSTGELPKTQVTPEKLLNLILPMKMPQLSSK